MLDLSKYKKLFIKVYNIHIVRIFYYLFNAINEYNKHYYIP